MISSDILPKAIPIRYVQVTINSRYTVRREPIYNPNQ